MKAFIIQMLNCIKNFFLHLRVVLSLRIGCKHKEVKENNTTDQGTVGKGDTEDDRRSS